MRKEFAIVLAALSSVIPCAIIAYLGGAESNYGLMIMAANAGLYLVSVVLLLAFLPVLMETIGFVSLKSYIFMGLVCATSLYILIMQVAESRFSGFAGASGLLTAFLLVPVLENSWERSPAK